MIATRPSRSRRAGRPAVSSRCGRSTSSLGRMAGSDNRWLRTKDLSGDAYDARYDERAAAGENVHGEADFVERLAPRSVLDAGCGTGRVARELARRGIDVVGVDVDPSMLATARRQAPDLDWRLGDLATIDLGCTFDVALLAGNVMLFVA